jgi:ATP-dependent Clp protease ATP-binding subunit ClpA
MFERFTEPARRVVFLARDAAMNAGNPEIGLDHLVFTLTQVDPALWRTTSSQAGVNVALQLKFLLARDAANHGPLPPSANIPVSKEAKEALRLAEVEAAEMHSEVIGTDHILLGVLKAGGAFKQYGVSYELALARILEEMARPRENEFQVHETFQRFTEKARRVVFFARYEASAAHDHSIEPEHLLLGLLREDKELWRLLAGPDFDSTLAIELRSAVPVKDAPEIPTSVDMPLSEGAKNTLRCAEAEAKKSIDAGHILLGLLKTGGDHPLFEILKQRGITYETVRARLPDETAGSAGA